MSVIIEEITKRHDRKTFDCGVTELNRFLQEQARRKAAKQIAKTWVACLDSAPNRIVGYYTLTGYSVAPPASHKDYKSYPHPLSAVKLARLAVDLSSQGQKLGQQLLIDAIKRTVTVADQIAAIGLFVDPKTPDVIPFYEQYGFIHVEPANDLRPEMWLPLHTCTEVVRETGVA